MDTNTLLDILDITDLAPLGRRLPGKIESLVVATQRKGMVDLPNVLVLRPDQLDILKDTRGLDDIYGNGSFYLYHTPHNIMDVQIKGQ